MVRKRSTSSSAANNIKILAANHQEAASEVQAAPIAPSAVKGRGRGRGRGQNARGRGANARDKPNEPMLFLEEIEEIFISLGCLETQAIELIGFRLKGATGQWWRGYKKAIDFTLPQLTWPQFKEAFRPKYAPNLILTEREKVRRFIEGLNPYMIKDMTSHQDDRTYLQVVNIATRKEAFDKIAREARDNSKKARTTGIYSGFSVGAKDIHENAFWVRKIVSNAMIWVILRETVHCLDKLWGKLQPDMQHPWLILVQLSPMCLLIFVSSLEKHQKKLGVPFEVSTPIGESVKVEYIFRNYIITIQGRETLADLNLLDMIDFDIIAAMNWLSSCHATVDCHAKTVKFSFIGENSIIIRGEVGTFVSKFISYLKARKLVISGCLAYLAHVRDMKVGSPVLESVSIVKEFSDVFPDDLPGIPPDREIEFGIDTLLGTQPISIPPYRMAQSELNELKKQL
ncbi:uncharacterized protein [Nicotiana tomentosiformis]|uniref:uncharacterized protein n=1 Tax=Nicotiana tomentosiformis TaxID=4098 RepID=UPI00388C3B93